MLHYGATSRSARIVVTPLHESPGPITAGASLFLPPEDAARSPFRSNANRSQRRRYPRRAQARGRAAAQNRTTIVDVDQNGWASKIDRAGAHSGGHRGTGRRKSMRKATLSLAIAVLFAASAALTADAQTSRGANNVGAAAQNFTPIEPAACRGWGPYCRPGFTRVCGRFRCWCRPC